MSEFEEKKASPPSSVGDQANKQANPTDFAERRKRALAEIDSAKFSWFHAKVALIAGAGFFTDASVLPSNPLFFST
jgi:PHS family inorganic phosphate transporter-like MFS transporter